MKKKIINFIWKYKSLRMSKQSSKTTITTTRTDLLKASPSQMSGYTLEWQGYEQHGTNTNTDSVISELELMTHMQIHAPTAHLIFDRVQQYIGEESICNQLCWPNHLEDGGLIFISCPVQTQIHMDQGVDTLHLCLKPSAEGSLFSTGPWKCRH